MGTNFYLYDKPDCPICTRPFEERHIGKSSGGWCFSLHVIPEDGIETLDDWVVEWSKPGALIRNEYGEKFTPEEMLLIVTSRNWRGGPPKRHDIDGFHCVGHGAGTWDLITGEFS